MKRDTAAIRPDILEQVWDSAARDAFTSEGGISAGTPEALDAAAHERAEARLMRSLFISRAGIDFMFAGFRYGRLGDAVAHARRYVGKDAIGEQIMLRPPDARD